MNTTVVLTLDTRRKKPDGTCSILLRMSKDRVSTQITLQVFVKEKDWDEQKRIGKFGQTDHLFSEQTDHLELMFFLM